LVFFSFDVIILFPFLTLQLLVMERTTRRS
jgi:hypothetical protein